MDVPDEAEEPRAPRGCRDVRLWSVAAELRAIHDYEGCDICPRGAPCSLVVVTAEAQDRAMRSYAERWLGGDDDYAVGRLYRGRLVGEGLARQCPPLTVRKWWWWKGRRWL